MNESEFRREVETGNFKKNMITMASHPSVNQIEGTDRASNDVRPLSNMNITKNPFKDHLLTDVQEVLFNEMMDDSNHVDFKEYPL